MLSSDKITEIFFVIGEFYKNFNEVVAPTLSGKIIEKRREIVKSILQEDIIDMKRIVA